MKLLIIGSLFLTGCMNFPYEGVIKESVRYVNEVHPEAFKKFSSGEEEIHYTSLGNSKGPLVLLIHGSPGSWASYANFYKNKELLEKYQVISFDRYGYGFHRRGEPHGSLDDQIAIVQKIIAHLNPDNKRKVIAVGHSYGGPVATYLAMRARETVHGVVLAAAAVDPALEEVKWYQTVAEWRAIRWMVPSDLDVCNREILALKDELTRIEPLYPSIKQPFYVLQGEIDGLVPKTNLTYLQEKLSQTGHHFELIPKARHFLPWAFPTRIVQAINQINKQINAPTGG